MTYLRSLSDRVEVAIVTFLQKNPNSIYLEIEEDLKSALSGIADAPQNDNLFRASFLRGEIWRAAWKLRPEDDLPIAPQ